MPRSVLDLFHQRSAVVVIDREGKVEYQGVRVPLSVSDYYVAMERVPPLTSTELYPTASKRPGWNPTAMQTHEGPTKLKGLNHLYHR